MTLELRPYQLEMVAALEAAWQQHHRLIAAMPTGSGKTEIASHMIGRERELGGRTLILVERKTLCNQWRRRLFDHGLRDVGVIQAENTAATYLPVVVGTIQSVRARGTPERTTLLVIDESHVWYQGHDRVLEGVPLARVLGLTATPLRAGLGLRFDRIVCGPTIAQLIEQGYLVRPRYFAPSHAAIEAALATVGVLAREYRQDQLSIAMRQRAIIGDVIATWQKRAEDRQTIAFAVDQAHARELAAEFLAAGIAAEVMLDDTTDDERVRIFAGFAERSIRVLCSVGVLGIGFDSPIASCAILARPTLSLSLHIQQGGRVLRPFPGKTDALILDHAANTLRHGRLEDFVPPDDLSKIDATTDKRSRKAAALAWVCRNCEAVNALSADVCCECGHPRRRLTTAVALDGELHQLGANDDRADDVDQEASIQAFYLMASWYAEAKGMRNPRGWAYYATVRRFKFKEQAARRAIPWSWRELAPIPADAEAARWFRADYQRSRIVARYRAGKAA